MLGCEIREVKYLDLVHLEDNGRDEGTFSRKAVQNYRPARTRGMFCHDPIMNVPRLQKQRLGPGTTVKDIINNIR